MMLSFYQGKVTRFTNWTRKGYAVFNSFKGVVTIGVLPLSYCLLALPMATFAQTDSVAITKNVDVEEVVVNASKKASTYSELTRVVTVLSRDDLGQRSTAPLGELLEQLTAIDIRQRGAHGVQADINLRGGTFDQVLIMLNGVNITDPQTGHHNLNIPINLDAIERIEILQGPGAREFGAGAFAGAINIITKPNERNRGLLSVFGSEYGLMKLNASQNFGNDKIRIFASGSYEKSNGYIDNTDFKTTNFFIHSTYKIKADEVNFFAGFQDKSFGANSFYTPKYPNQFEATRVFLSSLGYQWSKGLFDLNASVYYRKHFDRFELFRSNPPAWYSNHNYHTTDIYGAKFSAARLYRWGKTDAGVELRREEILSNKLGTSLVDSVKVWGENAYYKMGGSRNSLALYATQVFYLSNFAFSTGGQANITNHYGNIYTWGIDLSYGYLSFLKPFASVNRSFRLPTYTDLYYQGASNVGNPNLRAEFATTYEGGIKSQIANLKAELALFYRQGTDIIDWVKQPTETVWTTINYTKLNTRGANFFVQIDLSNFNIYTHKLTLNYSYTESDKVRTEMDSYYVLDNLKHSLAISGYHSAGSLFFNWIARYQDRNGEYLKYIDANTSIPTKYSKFWLVDMRLGYSFRKINIFIDATNMLNQEYVDIANVQQPKRWIGAGLQYRFDI